MEGTGVAAFPPVFGSVADSFEDEEGLGAEEESRVAGPPEVFAVASVDVDMRLTALVVGAAGDVFFMGGR